MKETRIGHRGLQHHLPPKSPNIFEDVGVFRVEAFSRLIHCNRHTPDANDKTASICPGDNNRVAPIDNIINHPILVPETDQKKVSTKQCERSQYNNQGFVDHVAGPTATARAGSHMHNWPTSMKSPLSARVSAN
ncbi:MAG TPA: hypothetical protein PKN33_11940 [Phycisphaerae bacterium]|nr:hypothetical protein [Phycisphaerae bacterium]